MNKLFAVVLLMFATTASAQFINQNIAATGPNNAFGLAFGVDRTGGTGITVGQLLRTAQRDAASPLSITLIAETWAYKGSSDLISYRSHLLPHGGHAGMKLAYQAILEDTAGFSPPPPDSDAIVVQPIGPFDTVIDLRQATDPNINLFLFPNGKALRYNSVTNTLYLTP